MNGHSTLPSGRVVVQDLNHFDIGVDRVTLDTFADTGVALIVDIGGEVRVFRDVDGFYQSFRYRVGESYDGHWKIDVIGGFTSVVVGDDRLRVLGELLETLEDA